MTGRKGGRVRIMSVGVVAATNLSMFVGVKCAHAVVTNSIKRKGVLGSRLVAISLRAVVEVEATNRGSDRGVWRLIGVGGSRT